MRRLLLTMAVLALPVLGMPLSGCTAHERLHHDLGELHEEFHEHPHTQAEHDRFHDDLGALHEDAHERGYDNRY